MCNSCLHRATPFQHIVVAMGDKYGLTLYDIHDTFMLQWPPQSPWVHFSLLRSLVFYERIKALVFVEDLIDTQFEPGFREVS